MCIIIVITVIVIATSQEGYMEWALGLESRV